MAKKQLYILLLIISSNYQLFSQSSSLESWTVNPNLNGFSPWFRYDNFEWQKMLIDKSGNLVIKSRTGGYKKFNSNGEIVDSNKRFSNYDVASVDENGNAYSFYTYSFEQYIVKFDKNFNRLWNYHDTRTYPSFSSHYNARLDKNQDIILVRPYAIYISTTTSRLTHTVITKISKDSTVVFDQVVENCFPQNYGGNFLIDDENNTYLKVSESNWNVTRVLKFSPRGDILIESSYLTNATSNFIIDSLQNLFFGLAYGNGDVSMVKLDKFGNQTWQKTFVSKAKYVISLTQDKQKNFFLATTVREVGDTDMYYQPKTIQLYKFDSEGNKLWEKNIKEFMDYNQDVLIQFDSSGNIFLNGTFREKNLHTIRKLSPNGDSLWRIDSYIKHKALDWYNMYTQNTLRLNSKGEIYSLFVGLDVLDTTRYSLFLKKYDKNGKLLFNKTPFSKDSTDNYLLAFEIDSLDNTYLYISNTKKFKSKDYLFKNFNMHIDTLEISLLQVDSLVDNLPFKKYNSHLFKIFPNPNEGTFTVVMPKDEYIFNLFVTDMLGNNITYVRETDYEIKLQQASKGVYTITIQSQTGKKYVGRVVVR